MKVNAFLLLIIVCSVAVSGGAEPVKYENKKLDGTWVVESVLRDPREKDREEGKGIRCVIEGTKVVAKLPGEDNPAGTLIIKIDPTKKLKTMDIRPEGEKDTILAIYEQEGDTLKVCISPVGKERPTEFASKPGTGHALVVLKREKP